MAQIFFEQFHTSFYPLMEISPSFKMDANIKERFPVCHIFNSDWGFHWEVNMVVKIIAYVSRQTWTNLHPLSLSLDSCYLGYLNMFRFLIWQKEITMYASKYYMLLEA